MGVYVSNLCKSYVRTHSRGILFATMKRIVLCMLRLSLSFLRTNNLWLAATYYQTLSSLCLILRRVHLMTRKRFFAGVRERGNCREIVPGGTVAKKNTQICRLSVGCVTHKGLRRDACILLIVAGRAILFNHIAERYCYV